MFKHDTDNTTELSKIFDKNDDIDKLTKKFLKRLDGFLHKIFKKIRVTKKVDKKLESLYTMKSELRNKTDFESKKKLAKIEEEMADTYSEEMFIKIRDELKGINREDGGWNSGYLWNLELKYLLNQQSHIPQWKMMMEFF